jgi:hypothetical protein
MINAPAHHGDGMGESGGHENFRWNDASTSIRGHSSWFFWYVAVGAAVAFVATLTLPETKGSVLR